MKKQNKEKEQITYPEPPEHLSDKSKELWKSYVGNIVMSPGSIALFQVGLECLDRADQAKAILDSEGIIQTTSRSGVSHCHPCVQIEKESRTQVIKIWLVLNLQMNFGWEKLDDLF